MKPTLSCLLTITLLLAGNPCPSQAVTADETYLKGSSLYKNGQWKQSIEQFEEAVRLNPIYWQAYQAMGYAFVKDGTPRPALNAFLISLKINPNNPALEEFMKTQFNTEITPSPRKPTDVASGGAVAVSIGSAIVVLFCSLIGNVNGGSC